jgi:hypothetical protein
LEVVQGSGRPTGEITAVTISRVMISLPDGLPCNQRKADPRMPERVGNDKTAPVSRLQPLLEG